MMQKRPLRAARRIVTVPLRCRLMEGANLVLSRAPLLEPVVRLVGWEGGATIVLEDLGADAPATVTRAEFGMCAGHGVRSPTSSKVQGGSKSRSWQGRSSASQPSRCRASPQRSWAKGRCRDCPASTLFKSPTAELVHNGTSCCFDCVQVFF